METQPSTNAIAAEAAGYIARARSLPNCSAGQTVQPRHRRRRRLTLIGTRALLVLLSVLRKFMR
jgi:hypothetical protein